MFCSAIHWLMKRAFLALFTIAMLSPFLAPHLLVEQRTVYSQETLRPASFFHTMPGDHVVFKEARKICTHPNLPPTGSCLTERDGRVVNTIYVAVRGFSTNFEWPTTHEQEQLYWHFFDFAEQGTLRGSPLFYTNPVILSFKNTNPSNF